MFIFFYSRLNAFLFLWVFGNMEKTVIDLEALKNKYKNDSIPHHMWSIAFDCKKRRDAFWRHSRRLKTYNNILSVPLLILSSLTGLTSVAQLGVVTSENSNTEATSKIQQGIALPLVVTISGVLTAVLTASQRYFRYAERSEHSKLMAKNYARIARRIENTMMLVESSVATLEAETFKKFVEDIQKDVDSLMQEVDDMPEELVKSKKFWKTLFKNIKQLEEENMNETISQQSRQLSTQQLRQAVATAREAPVLPPEISPPNSEYNAYQDDDYTRSILVRIEQDINSLKEQMKNETNVNKLRMLTLSLNQKQTIYQTYLSVLTPKKEPSLSSSI